MFAKLPHMNIGSNGIITLLNTLDIIASKSSNTSYNTLPLPFDFNQEILRPIINANTTALVTSNIGFKLILK